MFFSNKKREKGFPQKDGRYDLPQNGGALILKDYPHTASVFLTGGLSEAYFTQEVPLPKETEELTLYGGSFADISFLKGVTGLRRLVLDGVELQTLKGLCKLEELSVLHCRVKSFEGVTDNAWLGFLHILDTPQKDFSFVQKLQKLEELFIEESGIEDVSPIAGIAGLSALSLTDNPHLGSLAPLKQLPGLMELTLGQSDDPDKLTMLIEEEVRQFFEGGDTPF